MAGDPELGRLKTAQDAAYKRKQEAYTAQQDAWKRRSAAKEIMDAAYKEKARTGEIQNAAWQESQRVRNSNSARIDQLKAWENAAYINMSTARARANDAHASHYGAAARSYSNEAKGYRAEADDYKARRFALIAESRSAGDRLRAVKPAAEAAKTKFFSAKADYDRAKQVHEDAKAKFVAARTDFDKAKEAFQKRLETVRAANKRRDDDKKSLAEKAGVPYQYRDKTYVSTKPDGTVNIYFGGVGTPNGPGHGHYAMDRNGKVTYKRDPFDPHGAKNFQRDADLERRLGALGMAAAERDRRSTSPWSNQYNDGSVTIKVKSGFNARTNSVATDVIVIDRVNSPDEHLHLILSDHDGTVLFSEWRKNR